MCRGRCWCIANSPMGCFALPLGILQISFVIFCTIKYVILPEFGTSYLGIANLVFFGFTSFMTFWCEFATVFTNPGTIPNASKLTDKEKYEAIRREQLICDKCNTLRPIRAYHCDTCKTCIIKEDHHCPWVNNCVGARNQKYFILFMCYALLGELYATIIGSFKLKNIYTSLKYSNKIQWIPFNVIFPMLKTISFMKKWNLQYPIIDLSLFPSVLLALEVIFSVVFIIFLIIMIRDQFKTLNDDLAYADFLRSRGFENKEETYKDCLINMMGEEFCWRWFFPLEGKDMEDIINCYASECPSNMSRIEEEEEEEDPEEKKNK